MNKREQELLEEIEKLRYEIRQIKDVLNMILGLITDDEIDDEEPLALLEGTTDFDLQMLN